MALTSDDRVFFWGVLSGPDGPILKSEGNGLVELKKNFKVSDICCGNSHIIALSEQLQVNIVIL